jgi:hypothetical protein
MCFNHTLQRHCGYVTCIGVVVNVCYLGIIDKQCVEINLYGCLHFPFFVCVMSVFSESSEIEH